VDPVEWVKTYHAHLNAHDVDACGLRFSQDATYESVGLGRLVGRPAIKSALRKYFELHPNHYAVDESIVQTGPLVACANWRLSAKNKATGELISRRGTEDITFDTAGQIVSIKVSDC
jgi:SnoaL-like domain